MRAGYICCHKPKAMMTYLGMKMISPAREFTGKAGGAVDGAEESAPSRW